MDSSFFGGVEWWQVSWPPPLVCHACSCPLPWNEHSYYLENQPADFQGLCFRERRVQLLIYDCQLGIPYDPQLFERVRGYIGCDPMWSQTMFRALTEPMFRALVIMVARAHACLSPAANRRCSINPLFKVVESKWTKTNLQISAEILKLITRTWKTKLNEMNLVNKFYYFSAFGMTAPTSSFLNSRKIIWKKKTNLYYPMKFFNNT